MSLFRTFSSSSHHSNHSRRNSLDHAPTRDALTGHDGHLSAAQEDALQEFKAIAQEHKLYTSEQDGKRASHDDATMLRFLRARKFDPVGALGQFKDTEEWRKSTDIDALYEHFDIKSYEDARVVYPQWTGRRDRRGIPLYVYVIKHLNSKNMAAYAQESSSKATAATHKSSTISPKLLRLFALYENMLQFVLPLCSLLDRPHPESQIVSTTNIVDISGVGLKQFWNLKGHMQEASTLATAHYPETLDRIFIIGAPAFFPTVWGWIKKWFDPVTTSKIFILSASEVKPTLSRFIDPDNFPKRYGGNMDWDFGMFPHLDQNGVDIMGERYKTEEGWIQGPIKWVDGKCIAYGSVDGKNRRELVAELPPPQHSVHGINGSATTPTTTTPQPGAAAPDDKVDMQKTTTDQQPQPQLQQQQQQQQEQQQEQQQQQSTDSSSTPATSTPPQPESSNPSSSADQMIDSGLVDKVDQVKIDNDKPEEENKEEEEKEKEDASSAMPAASNGEISETSPKANGTAHKQLEVVPTMNGSV